MKTNKFILACVAASVTLLAHAENKPVPVLIAKGAFIALSVPDVKASGQWYVDKLGLEVTMRPQRSGPGEVMVLEGGGLVVELVQHDEAVPLSKLTPERSDAFKIHGYFKAGVIVQDLDKTLAQLKSRGLAIAFGPYAARDGRRANFIIRDNAGNLIHFFGG